MNRTAARAKPVWIWLPGMLEPVQAGVFTWQPGLGRYHYESSYRQRDDGMPLDPLHLPWTRSARGATEIANDGVFGAFRDASPEGFGLALLEREMGRQLNALDRLEHAPGDTVGALAVGDSVAKKLEWRPPAVSDLVTALAQLPATRADGAAAREMSGLPGTSVGGERPKITVSMDGHWWIAKLQDRADIPHFPAREYVAMQLAAHCGIRVATTRFLRAGEREFVAVQRFDRSPAEVDRSEMVRHAFASAHTVLHLGQGEVKGDRSRTYPAFSHELRRWCGGDARETTRMQRELWRRMAFNALVGNGDDHPRNHAVLHRDGHWGLSPAYDIVSHPQTGGVLAMGMTPEGDAIVSETNLLKACRHFGYEPEEARSDLRLMAERILDTYQTVFRETGLAAQDLPDLADSFTLARSVVESIPSHSAAATWEQVE